MEKVAFFGTKNIQIITLKEGVQNRIDGNFIEYIYSTNKASLNWAITSLFQLLQIPSPPIDAEADAPEIYEQYILSEKENSLAKKYPDIAGEWHPTKNGNLDPLNVYPKSNKTVWWQCSKGHEWKSKINNRVSLRRNCPYCAGQRLIPGQNDLVTTNQKLAAEWHPTKNGSLKPSDVMEASNKRVWWLGQCGHEWDSKINNRSVLGRGCPVCAGKKVVPGFNDLASQRPNLAAEWHPSKNGALLPSQVTKGSNKRVWWLGKCGHEWETAVSQRALQETTCPICARRRRKND